MKLMQFDESGKQLPDGFIPDEQISFDPSIYHFFDANGNDLTNIIPRSEKIRAVPGFDIKRDNIRLSNEQGAGRVDLGDEPLDESTAKIFTKQILTDPLAATIEAVNNTANKFFALPGIQKILIAGAAVAVLYIIAKKA